MWPFRVEPPTITSLAYARWLRAQRPPSWFWDLNEDDQEHFAQLGDDYVQTALEIGQGVGQEGQPNSDEVSLIRQIAQAVATKNMGGLADSEPAVSPSATMAGLGKAKADKEAAEVKNEAEGLRLFGQAPDGTEATG